MKKINRKSAAQRVRVCRPGIVAAWLAAVDGGLARAGGAWIVDVPGDVLRYSSRSALFCDAAYNVAVLHDIGVLRHSKVVER